MIFEPLQSKVNNFTSAFFGPVDKFDVSPGVVGWSLPCGLNLGLPTDPRTPDEGVSCYFLRLFSEAVAANKGKTGAPGHPGSVGISGFTLTLSTFVQPVNSSPVTVKTLFNPIVVAGSIIYIDKSGWYNVLSADATGGLILSLIQPMLGATGVIAAGRKLFLTGPKGQDLVGPVGFLGDKGDKGDTGIQGDQGIPGDNGETLTAGATQQNFMFTGVGVPLWVDQVMTSSAALVNFSGLTGDAVVQGVAGIFNLTAIGKYLFRTITYRHNTGSSGVAYTGLVNITDPSKNVSPDPAEANKFVAGSYAESHTEEAGVFECITACCLLETTTTHNRIEYQAFGKGCRLMHDYTTVTWVRVT